MGRKNNRYKIIIYMSKNARMQVTTGQRKISPTHSAGTR